MAKFIIQGGQPLRGQVSLLGAKNASIKLLIASLLTKEPCRLDRLPDIGDVQITIAIMKALGGKIKKTGDHAVIIDNSCLTSFNIPKKLGQQSRSASMFIGPLAARFGQVVWPVPGGCKIGQRPINHHLEALEKMGIKIKFQNGSYAATAEQLIGIQHCFPKNTHTGTETLIMAAVLAKGETILENAAQEPEVDDLISFLNQMGSKIKRVKQRTIKIRGVKKLHGAKQTIMFDRNEAVTFACAALATRGEVLVKGAESQHLTAFLKKLKEIGAGVEIKPVGIRFFYRGPLKATQVATAPHPGFMTDWQSLWTVLMTQTKGKSMIHETVFESRFAYAPFLEKMGAKIEFFNPKVKNQEKTYNFDLQDDQPDNFHAIRFQGPIALTGTKICVPDIRAGATLTLAALIAKGETILTNISHIDRGYEKLDARLCSLGAKIKRI